jgi:hypothetical protein
MGSPCYQFHALFYFYFFFAHAAFSSMVRLVVLGSTAINTIPPPRMTFAGMCGNYLISLISQRGGPKLAHMSGQVRFLAPLVRSSHSWISHRLTGCHPEGFAENPLEPRYIPAELSTPLCRLTGMSYVHLRLSARQ